jgi:hypothetical protein
MTTTAIEGAMRSTLGGVTPAASATASRTARADGVSNRKRLPWISTRCACSSTSRRLLERSEATCERHDEGERERERER